MDASEWRVVEPNELHKEALRFELALNQFSMPRKSGAYLGAPLLTKALEKHATQCTFNLCWGDATRPADIGLNPTR